MSITKEINARESSLKDFEVDVDVDNVDVNENENNFNELLNKLKDAITAQNFYLVKNICSQIPPNTLENEFVELAIKTKNYRIADIVFDKAKYECFTKDTLKFGFEIGNPEMLRSLVRRTNREHFDKEILNSAVKTRNYSLIQDVSQKTDTIHFDREILQTALDTKIDSIARIIITRTPNQYFDKSLLIQTLKANNPQLARSIISKTDVKHFDREILDLSIATKNGFIVNDVCSKTNPVHFDKALLYKAIDSGVGTITKAIAAKTAPEHFDKEALYHAIKTRQGPVVSAIAEKASPEHFDKDLLLAALNTKNGHVIHSIAEKTDKSYFDKNVLMLAIQTKEDGVVRAVGSKANKEYFDKEVLHAAIDTNVPKVVYACGRFADTKLFDKEMLDKVLNLNNAEMVRSVVDHLSDKDLFVEYKQKIQHAILKGNDIQNLTAQILSRRDNESFDREMQEVILDIYMDVITNNFKKGTVPANFPMKQFVDSMAESRFFFSSPDSINLNSLNEKNRFLLLPVYSYGHAFSAVVRKLENDNISITFVNLGARPFERGNAAYKEYVYTPENAMKILRDHSYSVRIHYPEKAVDTYQAYRNFKQKSLEEYTINVTSRDQKVGNCFLKNIEKGVRYALALGLSQTADKDFDPKTLRVTAESNGKLKVKFLKPFFKPGEKTNDLTTLELREELIKSLLNKFPQYEKEITSEWNLYKTRKERTITPAPKPDIIPDPYTPERKIARVFNGFPKFEKTFGTFTKENSTKHFANARNYTFLEKLQNIVERNNDRNTAKTMAM